MGRRRRTGHPTFRRLLHETRSMSQRITGLRPRRSLVRDGSRCGRRESRRAGAPNPRRCAGAHPWNRTTHHERSNAQRWRPRAVELSGLTCYPCPVGSSMEPETSGLQPESRVQFHETWNVRPRRHHALPSPAAFRRPTTQHGLVSQWPRRTPSRPPTTPPSPFPGLQVA